MFYYDAAYIILKHFYANTSSYLPWNIAQAGLCRTWLKPWIRVLLRCGLYYVKTLFMQTPLALYHELLRRLVCVGPGGNLEYMFYNDAAYIMLKHFHANTSCYLPWIIAQAGLCRTWLKHWIHVLLWCGLIYYVKTLFMQTPLAVYHELLHRLVCVGPFTPNY